MIRGPRGLDPRLPRDPRPDEGLDPRLPRDPRPDDWIRVFRVIRGLMKVWIAFRVIRGSRISRGGR